MKDPAHHNCIILKLQRELEELLAYMQPSSTQRERIKRITTDIAFSALAVREFYEEK
jgi:hypothetical protein